MKNTAKPIFTVGIPDEISATEIDYLREELVKSMPDYYVIVYPFAGKNPKFECFYEKDFNEVKYEELKNIVKNYVETPQRNPLGGNTFCQCTIPSFQYGIAASPNCNKCNKPPKINP